MAPVRERLQKQSRRKERRPFIYVPEPPPHSPTSLLKSRKRSRRRGCKMLSISKRWDRRMVSQLLKKVQMSQTQSTERQVFFNVRFMYGRIEERRSNTPSPHRKEQVLVWNKYQDRGRRERPLSWNKVTHKGEIFYKNWIGIIKQQTNLGDMYESREVKNFH